MSVKKIKIPKLELDIVGSVLQNNENNPDAQALGAYIIEQCAILKHKGEQTATIAIEMWWDNL